MKRTTAFWDSSALIPLCVQERTSNQAKTLVRNFAPVVWWATTVELHSAIARLHRSGALDDHGRQAALDRLTVVSQGWREVLPSDALRHQAGELLDVHPLRAADSLQLASAMVWCRQHSTGRKFISSDLRLCEAATQLGFVVVNPNAP